jgi:hypothetical protein
VRYRTRSSSRIPPQQGPHPLDRQGLFLTAPHVLISPAEREENLILDKTKILHHLEPSSKPEHQTEGRHCQNQARGEFYVFIPTPTVLVSPKCSKHGKCSGFFDLRAPAMNWISILSNTSMLQRFRLLAKALEQFKKKVPQTNVSDEHVCA